MKFYKYSLILILIFTSCTPSTHQSFVKRADCIYKGMINILKSVEDPGDYHHLNALKPLYVEIAELMVVSIKQEEKNSQLFNLEIIEAPHQEELKQQFIRIYQLEGGRKAIEQIARDGLVVLQKSSYFKR